MDKVYEISLLLDFYGQLLTPKQYEMLDLHFNNDYSLGEIGEQLKISRQAVHDNIKRSKSLLYDMEDKLRLVKRFCEQKTKAQEVLGQVRDINGACTDSVIKNKLEKLEHDIEDIINNI